MIIQYGLILLLVVIGFPSFFVTPAVAADGSVPAEKHLLYAALPGIRDELKYGGHGVLVFDMNHEHQFVKRIPLAGLGVNVKPLNVKGVCANAATKRLYVSTTQTLTCLDLLTEKILWEKPYEGGCDRMSISPDGKVIYLPTFEKNRWHVVDSLSGDVIKKIDINSGSHNTIIGLNGAWAYLAGLKSPLLRIADTKIHAVIREVGPFSEAIRPFTVNGRETLCFVCINGLLGFEIGDLNTGKKLYRVEVEGFEKGPVLRHGCPSHGIGMTPNEKEIWLADAHNKRLHIFDATVMPPKQVTNIDPATGGIALRDEPGWITFSIDGRYAYPSTGDVIDTATHRIIARLKDENGRDVQSEKMLEIDFVGNQPVRAGDQFGLGRITSSP